MRKLVVLVVLAGALLAGDVAARSWAESKLAEQVAAYYPPSTAATASIRSFPFLGRLLFMGEVRSVSVGMENLRPDLLLVRRLGFDFADVRIDRRELLGGQVRLTDVGQGRVEATIDGASLAQVAGADLRFSGSQIEIHKQVRGVDVFAVVRGTLEGNTLRLEPVSVQGVGLSASDFALTYDIPGVELLPCAAEVSLAADGLVVACTVDDVPPALVQGVVAAPS